jgi:hypothetical protein
MLVEISVVDTHPPVIQVVFPDQYRVSKPLRMENFLDEAARE